MNRHLVTVVCVLSVCGLACRSHDRQAAAPKSSPTVHVSQILHAAESNDEDRLRKLISAGADIDRIGDSWGTALYQAVSAADVNAVKLLLKCGADVNKSAADGCTPLHAATGSGSEHAYEIVEMLILHGADVNAKIRSDNASDGWMHMAGGYTPLHNAVGVELIDEDLETRSNIAVVELLLTHGARVNEKDGYGYTPLFYLVFPGFHDVMELLIEHGANVNIKNGYDGGTALHDAAHCGLLDTVAWLIAHGADVHARDFNGETPLHRAALGRYSRLVEYLVAQGADLHAVSKRNETPQDFLDEPEDTAPILLPDSNDQVLSLIVTDGLAIRRMLKSRSIDYDSLWSPVPSDINRLRQSLREWLETKTPQAKNVYVNHDRILSHLDQYDCQYAGFVKDGARCILCNMVQELGDPASRAPRNDFSGMIDGGCSWVVVVFEAQTQQVVQLRCNNI